ncbi:MAG: hypothetical protein K9N09_04165 [Candidatus Cloacimonetes bacterium]|nr:hypothetical protein [Candidatus Cloacimonadota bacterium]MCF7814482.1 hypothetical protein [Candidatus Cloacimonadota bacterium]MCF7867874.1 hypothetical protein [Candidatus Cloacimonadota bacterium]MCF7883693.1 hypothetical protein [Candidatus Cloacimonadota bacterium]
MNIKKLIPLFALICVNSWLVSTTWYINLDGTGDFTTIQEGINASVDNDTVLVYPGTYYENLDFNGKSITLCSQELITGNSQFINSTIIDGQNLESCIRIHNGETNAIIRGFTIQHGYGTQFWSHDGGGILVHDYSTAFITNCIIKHNKASLGAGIYARHGFINLSGVTLYENYGVCGGAVYLDDDSSLNCDPDNLCNIYNNYAGRGSDIYVQDTGNIEVIVDTFTVFNPSRFFAEYYEGSTLTVNIQNNWMNLIPEDLYVSTNGDDNNSGITINEPLKTISWAIHKIQANEQNPRTIHIANGTYSYQENQQIYPIGCKEFVSIVGQDMDNTILCNDFIGTNLIGFNISNEIEISDITLRNSSSLHTENVVYFSDMECLTLNNINISNNSNIDYIFTDNNQFSYYNNLLIEDNIIEGYSAAVYLRGSGYLKNSIISNNTNLSNPPIGCEVALHISARGNDSEFNIENCVISNNNTANSESCIVKVNNYNGNEPTIRFTNCIFNDNYCADNFLFCNYNFNGTTIMNNCTLADNTTGGSFYSHTIDSYGDLILNNTIMHNDPDYEIFLKDDTINGNVNECIVNYSNIKNGEAGTYNQNNANIISWEDGNISLDPQFLLSQENPYQLSEYSPCIDTGTPDTTGLLLPPYDLLYHERIWDGDNNGEAIIDMGCYEFGADSVGVENHQLPMTNSQMTNYPNPFNPSTTISFDLTAKDTNTAKIEIYNLNGQKVKILSVTLSEVEESGINQLKVPRLSTQLRMTQAGKNSYSVIWNGTDQSNKPVSSGIYFARLKAENVEASCKMLLLK